MLYGIFSVWVTNIFTLPSVVSKLIHSEETLTGGPRFYRV